MANESDRAHREPSLPPTGGEEATAAELVRHALDEARNLAQLELSLAREEMRAEVAGAKTGGVILGTAAAFALAGFTMCMVAIAAAFATLWLAALVIGLILLVFASALALGAWRDMPKKPMGETRDRIAFDVQQFKERARA
jgi:hypothetical protein